MPRSTTLSSQSYPLFLPLTSSVAGGGTAVAKNGMAVFDHMQLFKPQKGQYDLCLTSSLGELLPPVKIMIVEGSLTTRRWPQR